MSLCLVDKSNSNVQDFRETFDWVPPDILIKDLEQYEIKRVCINGLEPGTLTGLQV